MIDELDLAFDEHADRGRPRHRRGSREKRRTGGRSAVAFLMAFVLLGALGGGVYYGYGKVRDFFTAADYDGAGTDPVAVQIKDGSTITEIGNVLVSADVVKSTKAFVNAADRNPRGKNIISGYYNLRKQMSADEAVTALLDRRNRVVRGVTIPEGLSYKATFEKLSAQTKIPIKDLEAAAKDPVALGVPEWWFNRTDGKKASRTIEGFLYPATYEFAPNATATDVLKTMVSHFNTEIEKLNFVDQVQKKRRISPYEALIAASIAQAEAQHDKDMGPVVRVLYNRAYSTTFPCRCLQLDSTVNYWLRMTGRAGKASEKLTVSELHDRKNPYNTHDVAGMPVGPIGNPGEAALKGAMDPPPSSNVYFISVDTKGTMAYAKDDAGFQRILQIACRNGIPICNIN